MLGWIAKNTDEITAVISIIGMISLFLILIYKQLRDTRILSRLHVTVTYSLFSLIFAFISLEITGFEFGIQNNVFHIPYVLNLSESHEFLGDAFYSSLKHFTSIIWPMLRLVSNESNVQDVFYLANIISRTAMFVGILFLIRTNGLKTLFSIMICMTVIALTPWFQDGSVVGGHEIFLHYFTHTETAWMFVFLSLTLMSLHRLTSAFAMTGIVFSINAFVGIWLLLINLFTLVSSRKLIEKTTILKSAGSFLLFASPVVLWIFVAVDSEESAIPFSFIDYIRLYYPGHFLIETTSWQSLTMLTLVFLIGMLAAQYLLNKSYWISVQLACLFIFLIGIPLPYLLNSRFVFNLHLLRSAGLEQAIAIILATIAGTKLLFNSDISQRQLLGMIVLFSLSALNRETLSLIVVILALSAGLASDQAHKNYDQSLSIGMANRFATTLTWLSAVGFAFALAHQIIQLHVGGFQTIRFFTIASAFSFVLYPKLPVSIKYKLLTFVFLIYCTGIVVKQILKRSNYSNHLNTPHSLVTAEESWNGLVNEIRFSDLQGIFLVPIKNETFQLQARRKVWVDKKQGAAVMWSPSFHNLWIQRYQEVSALKNNSDFITYAQNHDIHYIVLESNASVCPIPSKLIKHRAHHILCEI